MKVHQLVHGYKKGHTELSTTANLPDDDSELITRLSDLSGSISSKGKLPHYVTLYPLKNKKYFAVAKTWPDLDAKRPGCVLTHTLLVPMQSWKEMSDPSSLTYLFKKPTHSDLSMYSKVLEVSELALNEEQSKSDVSHSAGMQFVSKFFDQGISPIIWVGLANPESLIWSLLAKVWPELRGSLSCCSYAIQPMMHTDHQFDWMFVPTKYSRNFDEFTREHFISENRTSKSRYQETWQEEWFQHLFESEKIQQLPESGVQAFFKSLDADPTSIRFLYLLGRQTHLMSTHPTAAAGILDLIEIIAPKRDSLVELKSAMCTKAIKAVTNVTDISHSATVLFAIDEKLQREAFINVGQQVRSTVQDSVKCLAGETLNPFLTALDEMARGDRAFSSSFFIDGIVEGIEGLSLSPDAEKLSELSKFSAATSYLVSRAPNVAVAYIQSSLLPSEQTEEQIVGWLSATTASEKLIEALLPVIPIEWRKLVRLILVKCRAHEISPVLTVLAGRTTNFDVPEIAELVIEGASSRFPEQTKEWCIRNRSSGIGFARTMASCYSPDDEGLNNLLKDTSKWKLEKALIVSEFLRLCCGDNLVPRWVREKLSNNDELMTLLLLEPSSWNETIQNTVSLLLKEVSNLKLPALDDLCAVIQTLKPYTSYKPLIDAIIQAEIRDYLTGRITDSNRFKCENSSWAEEWFATIPSYVLRSMISQSIEESTENIERVWRWVAGAPNTLYSKQGDNLGDLVIWLLGQRITRWTEDTTQNLRTAISRLEQLAPGHIYDRVCISCLQFCFNHTDLPISPIVVKTFYRAYLRVLDSRNENILIEVFDWDKGKELRKSVIRSYTSSNWPPGDLALATIEKKLLRKIIKRLLVSSPNGFEYLTKMISDLKTRSSSDNSMVLYLQNLRDNPFFEDWY